MPVRAWHVMHEHRVEALFVPHSGTYRDVIRRAIRVQNGARRRAPVDTGRLRSDIHVDAPWYDGNVAGARVLTEVEYAIYQEDGTKYMEGKHFLRDSLAEVMD